LRPGSASLSHLANLGRLLPRSFRLFEQLFFICGCVVGARVFAFLRLSCLDLVRRGLRSGRIRGDRRGFLRLLLDRDREFFEAGG
jgi:hypothetical protein